MTSSDFHEEVDFSTCEFARGARFSEVTFHSRTSFAAAKFRDTFSFPRVTFKGPAYFTKNEWADFQDRQADRAGHERAFFETRFDGSAVFYGTGLGQFSAFDGAIFAGEVYFDDTPEMLVKKGFKSYLKRALSVTDPQPRIDALRNGCQVIRRAMEKASDKKRSVLLHQLELRSRRHQAGCVPSERILSWLYGVLSDYGSSVGRPLLWLIALFSLFGIAYGITGSHSLGHIQLQSLHGLVEIPSRDLLRGLMFSAEQTFPFGSWASNDAEFVKALAGDGSSIWSLVLRLLGAFQSIASASLIFLMALAIRQRFQIG